MWNSHNWCIDLLTVATMSLFCVLLLERSDTMVRTSDSQLKEFGQFPPLCIAPVHSAFRMRT